MKLSASKFNEKICFSDISCAHGYTVHAYMDATSLFASNNECLLHWSSDNGFFGSA